MNVKEIQSRAKAMGIKNYSRLKKTVLIWTIQEAEGHDPCYTRIPHCGQMDCCWREDCQEIANQ